MKISIIWKVSCCASIASLFLSCSDATPSPGYTVPLQLMLDPFVDNGTSGWYSFPKTSDPYLLEVSKEESSSPYNSLKISCQTPQVSDISYWTAPAIGGIPLGKELTLTVKIKTKNLSGQGVSIVIRGDNSAQTNLQFATTQGDVSIIGNFDWSTYTVKLPSVLSGVKNIYVFLVYLPNTTGTVYFDDIMLTHN